jgi:hypothetical protein
VCLCVLFFFENKNTNKSRVECAGEGNGGVGGPREPPHKGDPFLVLRKALFTTLLYFLAPLSHVPLCQYNDIDEWKGTFTIRVDCDVLTYLDMFLEITVSIHSNGFSMTRNPLLT